MTKVYSFHARTKQAFNNKSGFQLNSSRILSTWTNIKVLAPNLMHKIGLASLDLSPYALPYNE